MCVSPAMQHTHVASLACFHTPPSNQGLLAILHATRYKGATNTSDDIAVINTHLDFVKDDVGNTSATALALSLPGNFSGLIGYGGDVDVFSITVPGSKRLNLSFALLPVYSNGTNEFPRSDLDAELLLNTSAGALVEMWTNPYGLLQGSFKSSVLKQVRAYLGVFVPSPGTVLPSAVRAARLKRRISALTSGRHNIQLERRMH